MNEEDRIEIYQGKNGAIELMIERENDNIWATQKQLAELFGVDRTRITRHINNILLDEEVEEKSNVRKTHFANSDRPVAVYGLDMILSVGYRVNSKNATKFRKWANTVLKRYMVDGVAINEKRLLEQKNTQLQDLLNVVNRLVEKGELKSGEANGILEVVSKYGGSFLLLDKYDRGEITMPSSLGKPVFFMTYNYVRDTLMELKDELLKRKQATDLFGLEKDNSLDSIVSNLYQSFDGEELYKSTAEKAANLFYQIIKDHPFRDGNKRIASFLFIMFLRKNKYHKLKSGEEKISARTIVALALLVAESAPSEKESLVTLICNLLQGDK